MLEFYPQSTRRCHQKSGSLLLNDNTAEKNSENNCYRQGLIQHIGLLNSKVSAVCVLQSELFTVRYFTVFLFFFYLCIVFLYYLTTTSW